ncbi:MAG: Gfo/Idh/MocA family oxidoreductase [Bryobacteraceae bacterium]
MHRRTFLMAAGTSGLAFAQGAGDSIGTGMIGVGNRGSYLLKTVLAQPNVKVTAVCDIKPNRLDSAATAAARDRPAAVTDYKKLLERENVNAVFIASPCDLHVEMAIAALKAGKHVYCEKPVGITPESIRELVRVARASKTVFQVGQQLRADARLRKTMERIHEGILGKVIMVKAQRHSSNDLPHDSPSADWFFDAKRSGDVLVEMAVHNLDECNWAVGAHPASASGFGGTMMWVNDPPGRTNMDGYTLSYEYTNGVKMSFTQMFFHPSGMPGNGQATYVYGTKGAVDLEKATFYPLERGAQPVPLVDASVKSERDAHTADFYEAIRTGKKPFADITVGATAALTAILGREAIYRKKVMHWRDFGIDL